MASDRHVLPAMMCRHTSQCCMQMTQSCQFAQVIRQQFVACSGVQTHLVVLLAGSTVVPVCRGYQTAGCRVSGVSVRGPGEGPWHDAQAATVHQPALQLHAAVPAGRHSKLLLQQIPFVLLICFLLSGSNAAAIAMHRGCNIASALLSSCLLIRSVIAETLHLMTALQETCNHLKSSLPRSATAGWMQCSLPSCNVCWVC